MKFQTGAALLTLAVCGCRGPVEDLATPDYWGELEPGPHAVGFRVERTFDASRGFFPRVDFAGQRRTSEWERPIQILLWYPAVESALPVLRYADYVLTQAARTRTTPADESERAAALREFAVGMRHNFPEISQGTLDTLLERPTASRREPPAAAGTFPLVIWSGDSAHTNTVLAEYLASHGYVVASAPGIGFATEHYVERVPNTLHLLTQVEDLGFTYAWLRDRPNVDATRWALGGFSTTNLATLLYQMKNMSADALISLEGHDRYPSGRALAEAPFYDPRRVRVPLLHVQVDSGGFARDTTIFDALVHSRRYLLELPVLSHPQLLSQVALSGQVSDDVVTGYQAACRFVRTFLDSVLKEDAAAARLLLEPAGAPDRFHPRARVSILEAEPPVPTIHELWNLVWK